MARRWLVTGGAGFIGSHFIRLALGAHAGIRIANLDALTYAGGRETVADLEGAPDYERNPRGPQRYRAAPFLRTNVQGAQTLLDAARRHGVGRFLHISTDEVYGSLGPEGRFTERSPLAPNSPYAASKAASELLVRAAGHTHGLPAVITRGSNTYGPCQFPEKLIPLAIARARADQPVPLYGQGDNVRNWLHVDDHARGILAWASRPA